MGSFNVIKDNQKELDNWFANEYPRSVLESQLLKPLTEKKIKLGEEYAKMLQEWLGHPRIKELFKEKEAMVHI